MSFFADRMKASYLDRERFCENAAGKKLFELMHEKKTNVACAVDVTKSAEFLSIVEKIGEELAVVKTHIDVLDDFSWSVVEELVDLSKKLDFMIFEDSKFGDIGQTVKLQYGKGIYKIADWAHFVNAHAVPGDGIVEGLYEVAKEKIAAGNARGCLLLAQMSSKGTLATGDYTLKTVEMAERNKYFVTGFIGAGSVPSELRKLAEAAAPEYALMTPGVQFGGPEGALKQQYASPEEAIGAGSDCIIVGGGIYKAKNPAAAAKEYRDSGWNAYLKRMGKS
jgi:orotidine 5'-phosphate decarboxylase subfamily 1